MKNLDPEQLSTEAHRALEDVKNDRPSGPYVTHDDANVLRELSDDGLAHEPEEGSSEAILTDQGILMLRAMGVAA